MIKQNNQEYTTDIPGYFTLPELSKICGYTTTEYLRRKCTDRKIEAYKTGTLWLIPYKQGLEFINERKNK